MKPCNVSTINRFLSGEMSDLEITSFEEHLETCDATGCGWVRCRWSALETAANCWRISTGSAASGSGADADGWPVLTAQVLSFVRPPMPIDDWSHRSL